jgi:deoxyribose-phosphate aldolase
MRGWQPATLGSVTPTVRGRTYEQVAGAIDHSLLRPELTVGEVEAGCELADRYRVAAVCCRPADVPMVVPLLAAGPVAVGTVVGFPHGSSPTGAKAHEARLVRSQGAVEIDMVLNIGWLRSGELARVEEEIRQVVAAADGALVKVILENAYLGDEQKVLACKAVEAAGAHYVKTSTGFAPTGATVEDIRLMRASVSPRVKVKAAHGVRTLDALLDVMDAGAERCGATATAGILDDFVASAGA